MNYDPKHFLYYLDSSELYDLRNGVYPSHERKTVIGIGVRLTGFPRFSSAGPSAAHAMCDYESRGKGLPENCSEPALLWAYIQGKWARDFTITNFKEGVRQKLFREEEFLETINFDLYEYKLVFGHFPDCRVLRAWGIQEGWHREMESVQKLPWWLQSVARYILNRLRRELYSPNRRSMARSISWPQWGSSPSRKKAIKP